MEKYNIIVENENDTVVSEYKPLANKAKDYQTESELESQFISMLKSQGYEYLNIHNEEDLINNLRQQIELLNKINFSDNEWKKFFNENIANKNFSIKDKSRIIQEDYRQLLTRDDGSHKNIILIDKDNIHNNKLQVINQYEEETGNYKNRYDVTILVNGIPMVHIELKRRGVALKEAFNQIIRYQRDSFWASNGLYEYVQVFVISNGANTKYYSNTTRLQHVNKKSDMIDSKTSKSFEFTHFWSDSKNNPIHDLIDFTSTFFSKHTILNILTKYCIFTSEEMLLVMRPYQIVAVEKIINKVNISHNYKKYGSIAAGGFIWHTTGSGKTLTSFKTAKLASQLPYINKVIFVVDRRDLDYQTMKEYDKLEKGAANSNRSTLILQRQLESNDPNKKIIITTIQKLSIFIKNNKNHPIYDKEVVLIFDECHRSQFGAMHTAVIKNFKKYYLFGFTGTPIFAANINKSSPEVIKTTEQAFGQKLHTYTIINAINDRNVLPFKIEYIKTIDVDKSLNDKEDQKVKDIDRESVFLDQRRIKLVVEYILKHFDQKTRRNSNIIYSHSISDNLDKTIKRNVSGFNSIMAVSSIEMAKKYYLEFKNQLAQDPKNNLKIALIYSYGVNTEESYGGLIDEEDNENTLQLSKPDRDFLDDAIKDYNNMFNTNFNSEGEQFQMYYKDVSLKLKNKDLDILIVVNMFLTGFDAPTLNTLWVDKKLREHGLIQAFSRTNRILNDKKVYGNIVCFRNLEKETDQAISIFGDGEASGIVKIKNFVDYYYGYNDSQQVHHNGYCDYIQKLNNEFPLDNWNVISEQKNKEFIILFGKVLKLKNILASFDEFIGKEILNVRDFQNYSSKYLDIKDEFKKIYKEEIASINDDVIFETELLKTYEVNIDYILQKVEEFRGKTITEINNLRNEISLASSSSPELRSKKQLIEKFVSTINNNEQDIPTKFQEFMELEKKKELDKIISEENLDFDKTHKFMDDSFELGEIKTAGSEIGDLLPKMPLFGSKGKERSIKKKAVLEKFENYFQKFYI